MTVHTIKYNSYTPNTVHLVVTSPPYPMIKMWDEQFVDGNFNLFPSHSRIIQKMREIGFQSLPSIIWRKPTNSPNKFMGSGMLPPGGYITLEHEYILIFRKGGKRKVDRKIRGESAYFWEERNKWFSDLWEITGERQMKINQRKGAAYPLEIPYRLINMFSVKGDMIFDPFLGTGTTSCAAIASERNSIGIEIDRGLESCINDRILKGKREINEHIDKRIQKHIDFTKKTQKNLIQSSNYKHVSKQEKDIIVRKVVKIVRKNENFIAYYK